MGCGCKNGKTKKKENATVKVEISVSGDGNPLACAQCLEKHVSAALVYATEVAEDGTRRVERMMLVGNLVAAEDHARALDLPDLAEEIRALRRAFQSGETPDPAAALRDLLPRLPS